MRGFFITVDGPDGCGKTTQSRLLARALREKGLSVVHTREPGGTPFSENVRRILLNPNYKIAPLTELMLYESSRAQHIDDIIKPALKKGAVVVCERYTDATAAYQGYGRKIDLSAIEKLNRIATEGLSPHLTFLLDIPAAQGLHRAKNIKRGKRAGVGDRLERENINFHNRVRQGYLVLAKKEPARIKVIPPSGSINEIHRKIIEVTEKAFLLREAVRRHAL